MTKDFETLKPVLGLACGKTIGDEPVFLFPEVLHVFLRVLSTKFRFWVSS